MGILQKGPAIPPEEVPNFGSIEVVQNNFNTTKIESPYDINEVFSDGGPPNLQYLIEDPPVFPSLENYPDWGKIKYSLAPPSIDPWKRIHYSPLSNPGERRPKWSIPEPATLLILGCGIAFLFRRKGTTRFILSKNRSGFDLER